MKNAKMAIYTAGGGANSLNLVKTTKTRWEKRKLT